MIRFLLLTLFLVVRPATAETLDVLTFGDSLTAGYGLEPRDSFPAKLEAALRKRGYDVSVHNAGVSGDTTSAALSRLDWALGENVDAVIVELGGNDALRGLDPKQTEAALEQIMTQIKARNVPVLVAGMRAPLNLGPEYAAAFNPIFKATADRFSALYYPFFLDGVAADPGLNQADGIHPNAAGVDVIVNGILPTVEALLQKAAAK